MESITKPHYQRLTLNEVANFIQKHRHLPNVYSAKEIKKQGVIQLNLALEQQLEKIEELFLYLLEQEKKIKALEAKLADFAQKILD